MLKPLLLIHLRLPTPISLVHLHGSCQTLCPSLRHSIDLHVLDAPQLPKISQYASLVPCRQFWSPLVDIDDLDAIKGLGKCKYFTEILRCGVDNKGSFILQLPLAICTQSHSISVVQHGNDKDPGLSARTVGLAEPGTSICWPGRVGGLGLNIGLWPFWNGAYTASPIQDDGESIRSTE